MSGIGFGNSTNPQGYYPGEYLGLPGYRVYKTSAYAALRPVLDNRFRLRIATRNRTDSPQNLTLPLGASIFSAGVRAGEGVWNEVTGSELHIGTVDLLGLPSLANNVKLHGLRLVNGYDNAVLNIQSHKIFRLNNGANNGLPAIGESDHAARSVWLRDIANLTAESLFDPINDYFKLTGFSGSDAIGLPESLPNRREIELQVRQPGGAALVNTGPVASGANAGGIRQIVGDESVKNKGFVIVDIGWYIRDDYVTESEVFNVAWDEVFRGIS